MGSPGVQDVEAFRSNRLPTLERFEQGGNHPLFTAAEEGTGLL
jgi:hypothetical protein